MGIPETKVELLNTKPLGKARAYVFSGAFTKKETWYAQAIQISGEVVGVGDGITTVFNLDHGTNVNADERIADCWNGLITDDHLIKTPSGTTGGYVPVVKLDGITQTQKKTYKTLGDSEYSIDYSIGTITFGTAPTSSVTITADYWYVPGSANIVIKIKPPSGKRWLIEFAEVQFSENINITDTIIFAPYIGDMLVGAETRYLNIGNFLDVSVGAFSQIPALGGSPRGLSNPTRILRWDYVSPIELNSTIGVELRIYLEDGIEFGGERATVSFYIIEENI